MDAGNQNTLSGKGSGDAYVVKVANNGQTDWAVSAGSSSATERAYAVDVTSNGDIMVGGMIVGSSDFGIHYLTSNGGLDLYMGKLSSSGDWDWVENLGSSSDDLFADLTVNGSDIPYTIGSFQSTINKGTQSVTSSAGLDLVIWSLDPVNNADSDNDGVNDLNDNCPNTNNLRHNPDNPQRQLLSCRLRVGNHPLRLRFHLYRSQGIRQNSLGMRP